MIKLDKKKNLIKYTFWSKEAKFYRYLLYYTFIVAITGISRIVIQRSIDNANPPDGN